MRRSAIVLSLALGACGSGAGANDGGAPDAPPPACDGVDRSCPESLPALGGACEGALSCRYPALVGCGPSDGSATCVEGRWQYDSFCLPGPMLYESCDAPESGPFPGTSLELTAPTSIVWGLQGNAMIEARFRITPGEDGPRCARASVALTFDGETAPYTHSVHVRCGEEVSLLEILPGYPCDARLYPYAIDLEIEGVGMQHVEGELMGGAPMGGPSPCVFGGDAGVEGDAGMDGDAGAGT